MLKPSKYWKQPSALIYPWLLTSILIIVQALYILICHIYIHESLFNLSSDHLIILRSIFYFISILLFPLIKLLRYIQLHLYQTMPGHKPATNRYLNILIVSQGLMALVGSFGFILCFLGDTLNSLYIFSGLAWLGFILNRPKWTEYHSIVIALDSKIK